ncbi:hypothetical protein B4065_1175 [Caldibacillus thermoamylovorans]|uniref:Uncharacterized protein n=1 Tax=Caldibacillus thermoamylovorans TaxID=35841 RepID=A0ABD4A3F2_9BACI|nr:hypothetical protein B4166_0253 [Caldibacillus thermoamylovorans]KIO61703.1 hypothetical protein B4065_1175 [Caldibacillus thermoamylovorans]KIO71262.1 hypothetical protein B4167_0216 [Caldibacillus thermoamylovorans]PAC36586.1 hypothetical protein CEJ87_05980 [Caldifermentibacillus hisashii]
MVDNRLERVRFLDKYILIGGYSRKSPCFKKMNTAITEFWGYRKNLVGNFSLVYKKIFIDSTIF